MMDAETAFCENDENMDIQESLVKFMLSEVITRNSADLKTLERDVSLLQTSIDTPWLRITHAEVVKQLQEMGSDIKD
jgi:aspartyl/asparaginyl-tRNA synthetase